MSKYEYECGDDSDTSLSTSRSTTPPPGQRSRARMDPPPMPVAEPNRPLKQKTPQEIVDEFWSKFTTKKPGKATTVIPQNLFAEKAAKKAPAPERTTQSSYAVTAAICRTKVKKIADECRAINRRYRDPHFDLEYDLKCHKRDCLESLSNVRPKSSGGEKGPTSTFSPMAVKRVPDIFDDPKFFINGPSTNDVRQGRNGDCWFLAALCTLSNKPGLIERICVARDEQVGVYGFVFHRDGEWVSEIIDDKLYLTKADYDEGFLERILWEDRERVDSEETYRRIYQSNSGALYFAQCENPNETWLPLLEKCYAKAHGDYAAIEGGFTGEGIEDLTGGVTTEIYTSDILDREAFWKNELMQVNKEFLFGCSTGVWGRGWGDRKGIVELHAYSVVKAVEVRGKRLVLLKNPWGKGEWKGPWSDGSKEWTAEWLQELNHKFGDDGAFWISYEDLIRKYQAFDRTRLFGDDWRVASIWTSLQVPWKQGYHDTHFSLTLSTPGEVVIVLSQLDDRYFRGLEGQYRLELAFRLHKAGHHEDYLIRSPSSYRMNRSVNVEVKLDAGEYMVMVKVDATRNDKILPVDDVIRNNAKERREKLLRIGLAYDLAHSKGQQKESPEDKAAKEAHEKRVERREKEELRETMMKEREDRRYMRLKEHNHEKKKMARRKAKREAKKAAKKLKGSQGKMAPQDVRTPEVKVQEPSVLEVKKQVQIQEPAGENTDPSAGAGNTPSTTDSAKSSSEERPAVPTSPTEEFNAEKESGEQPAAEPTPQESKSASSDSKDGEDAKEKAKEEKRHDAEEGKDKEEHEDGKGKAAHRHHKPPKPPRRSGRAVEDRSSTKATLGSDVPMFDEPEEYCESDDDEESDLETISEVSEVSDRELDIEYEDRRYDSPPPMPVNVPDGPPQGMVPQEPPDEFEKDPWNAVAVVGLRVYHKISEEDKDKEVVKLSVERPNPFSDDEDDDGKKKDDGGKDKKKGKKQGKSTGLDVDDSAKDATLQGTENERKMSIDPTQAKKRATGSVSAKEGGKGGNEDKGKGKGKGKDGDQIEAEASGADGKEKKSGTEYGDKCDE